MTASDLDLMVTRAKNIGGATNVYKINAVPASPGVAYMVLGLDTGTPTNRRTGGAASFLMRRMTVQCFGTSWEAVTDMATRADTAFDDKALTELTGSPYSVRELQTSPTRDPDTGGVLQILHVYRF